MMALADYVDCVNGGKRSLICARVDEGGQKGQTIIFRAADCMHAHKCTLFVEESAPGIQMQMRMKTQMLLKKTQMQTSNECQAMQSYVLISKGFCNAIGFAKGVLIVY